MKASLLTSAAVADDGGEGEGSDATLGEVIILVAVRYPGFSLTTDCFPLCGFLRSLFVCWVVSLTHIKRYVFLSCAPCIEPIKGK